MFFLLYKHTDDGVFDDFPKISDHFPKISEDFPKLFRRPDQRSRTFSENFRKFPKFISKTMLILGARNTAIHTHVQI